VSATNAINPPGTRIRRPLPATATVIAVAGTFVSATGLTQAIVFQQASTLKYVLTIVAPLLLLLVARVEHPVRVITVPAIVVAPFVNANAGFGGTRVSAIVPLLIAGTILAVWTTRGRTRRSSLALSGFLAFPLLLIPLADGRAVRSYVTTLALILALGWLVSQTARQPGGMTVVLGAVAFSGALQSLIALWEAHTGHLLNLYSSAGTQQYAAIYFYSYGSTKRPTGSFSDPISLGNALAIALPLTVVLALQVRRRLVRLAVVGAGVVIAVALTLTLSRASWIGAAVGIVLVLVLVPRGQRRRLLRGLTAGAALLIVVTLVAAGPAVVSRLASISNPTNTQGVSSAQLGPAEGDKNRLEYWRVSVFEAFGGHPVAGVGIGNLGPFLRDHVSHAGKGIRAGTAIFIHAHSTYFQILAEAGIFGLIMLVIFIRGLVGDAIAAVRVDRIVGPGVAGAAVALLICWTTDWVIHNPPVAASVAVVLGTIAAAGGRGRELANGATV
jgi:O-antigen ligase